MNKFSILHFAIFLVLIYGGVLLTELLIAKIENEKYEFPSKYTIGTYVIMITVAIICWTIKY